MPELPEVQTIVNDLNKKVIGRKITGVWFDWPKTIWRPDGSRTHADHSRTHADYTRINAEKFKRIITGKKILRIGRRGKNILIYLGDADKRGQQADRADNFREVRKSQRKSAMYVLLIHQKLTGHFLVGKWKVTKDKGKEKREKGQGKSKEREKIVPISPPEMVNDPYNSYIHLIFYLDNGQMLGLSDLRKFAKVLLGKKEEIENLPDLKKLGLDALDQKLTLGKFKETLRQGRSTEHFGLTSVEALSRSPQGKVKQVLMDQEIIAGIGNIYSDEILWLAKIHPFKPTNKLSEKELENLYAAMKKVLQKAVKMRGASISDYRDTAGKKGKYAEIRSVYQRENEPCPRCKTKIKRIKLAGRSAHFCPCCQKL